MRVGWTAVLKAATMADSKAGLRAAPSVESAHLRAGQRADCLAGHSVASWVDPKAVLRADQKAAL